MKIFKIHPGASESSKKSPRVGLKNLGIGGSDWVLTELHNSGEIWETLEAHLSQSWRHFSNFNMYL